VVPPRSRARCGSTAHDTGGADLKKVLAAVKKPATAALEAKK
jgi:hypothetical protein